MSDADVTLLTILLFLLFGTFFLSVFELPRYRQGRVLRLQRHRAGADGLSHRPENTAMSAVRRQVHSRVRILQRIGHSIQDEEILIYSLLPSDRFTLSYPGL